MFLCSSRLPPLPSPPLSSSPPPLPTLHSPRLPLPASPEWGPQNGTSTEDGRWDSSSAQRRDHPPAGKELSRRLPPPPPPRAPSPAARPGADLHREGGPARMPGRAPAAARAPGGDSRGGRLRPGHVPAPGAVGGRRARPAAAAHLSARGAALGHLVPVELRGEGRSDGGTAGGTPAPGRRRPPSAGHAPVLAGARSGPAGTGGGARRKAPTRWSLGFPWPPSHPAGHGGGALLTAPGAERLGLLARVTWKLWPVPTLAPLLSGPRAPCARTARVAPAATARRRVCGRVPVDLAWRAGCGAGYGAPAGAGPGGSCPLVFALVWMLDYGAGRACATGSIGISPRGGCRGGPDLGWPRRGFLWT